MKNQSQNSPKSQSGFIVIANVQPCLDAGRHPVKREVGDTLVVEAEVFREGHDILTVMLKTRPAGQQQWTETPMALVNAGLDFWRGAYQLNENTRYEYTIEAWTDVFESWRQEVVKKLDAVQNVDNELLEGRAIVESAAKRASEALAIKLLTVLEEFDAMGDQETRSAVMLADDLRKAMARLPERAATTVHDPILEVIVDRERARFGAWYEMFPRSQGSDPNKSATFADCGARLPEIREMGFDVIYLPPIHPIGHTFRKGRNNTLSAEPHEPGSPYAIGAEEGGHCAVNSELGTLEDFEAFVAASNDHGIEIALDFAVQCSPDHPWIKEHPEWFTFRPDGSIKYAENPPKKYQDIVNLNFFTEDRGALWNALRDVVLFWVDRGVKIFRVDNPHTKPVPFWEWMIREIQDQHPDVIFLAEAFTRPPMLKQLAKIGFSQSYTYFTWRNFKHELVEYGTELTQTDVAEYLRPNYFTNTPDILPPFLQTGGRPAFMIRLVLAATMSSTYGIYNSFELCEATAVPGTEEYLNSEKYEYKVWDWDRPGNIKDYIAQVNRIRRENPALHELDNLRFYTAHDDNVLFYGKMTPSRDNLVFVAVNLDPFDIHEAEVEFPLAEMGIPDDQTFEIEELLSGQKHLWTGPWHRLRLDPQTNPAAIFRVQPWEYVDFRSPCN